MQVSVSEDSVECTCLGNAFRVWFDFGMVREYERAREKEREREQRITF